MRVARDKLNISCSVLSSDVKVNSCVCSTISCARFLLPVGYRTYVIYHIAFHLSLIIAIRYQILRSLTVQAFLEMTQARFPVESVHAPSDFHQLLSRWMILKASQKTVILPCRILCCGLSSLLNAFKSSVENHFTPYNVWKVSSNRGNVWYPYSWLHSAFCNIHETRCLYLSF